MANHASHAALPYPIKGARYTVLIPYLDADGDPTDPTTPDLEVSKDDGAAADALETEASTYRNGVGMQTFSGEELDCSCFSFAAKAASGPKTTLGTLYPRVLASIGTGTLSAGSAGGGTLGTILPWDLVGCFIKTTGGTGGGGTGGRNNQARKFITYTPTTGAFTVAPNWETTPDNTTTYDVLLPDGVTLGMLRAQPAVIHGTLSGTHSSTTADLGTNAPSVDIKGQTLVFPEHNVSRVIDSYNTGTGVATFSPSTAVTLVNGNNWVLVPTPPASTGAVPDVALTAAAVDAILDEVVEGSTTLRQLLRGFASALLSKANGLATSTANYRDLADSKNRIVATVDADGNRSAITLDLT